MMQAQGVVLKTASGKLKCWEGVEIMRVPGRLASSHSGMEFLTLLLICPSDWLATILRRGFE